MQRLWQRMSLNRFCVLGRVGMDLNADPPGEKIATAGRFTTAIGGSAGNIAAGLARQDASVRMISCVSDDPVGSFCAAELARYGVDTRYLRVTSGQSRTSLALTETVAEDCQTVLYRNGAADLALTEADVRAIPFADEGALVVTGTALASEPSRAAARLAMALARKAGALVVLDVDYRAYSWGSQPEAARVCAAAALAADIVIGNDVEFGLLAGETAKGPDFARALAAKSALLAIYKRGPAGCTTFSADFAFETPVFRVQARKPTGAGDGFMAGFLAAVAQGHSLQQAVRRGAATAAMVVAGVGCAPASPDRAALDRFLADFQ